MSPAVQCFDLTMRFRSTTTLDRLNLNIPLGSIFGVVGPNGAGKTTTIKILMNLIQPTSGSAQILGQDSRLLGPQDFERIGYVSENQQLPEWMTIDQLLAYLKPFYPNWDDGLAQQLLKDFDLPGARKLKHLSRGMWMKAALLSSLAYRPELLVLDEPFTGLDPLIREDFIGGILDRAGESTVVLSSHDLAEIESFASHIAYLDQGRLQFAEELDSLSARFRQIEVSVDTQFPLPTGPEWPKEWMQPESSQALLRFVDCQFHETDTAEKIRRVVPSARDISVQAMPLRAIFLTLARNTAKASRAS